MADLSDVSNALGVIIGAALYPTTPSGEEASPVAGLPVRVAVGWPSVQSLEQAMKCGKGIVSIYPSPKDRNTSRYLGFADWQELSRVTATYTLTVAGQAITIGGAPPTIYTPQNLAVMLNGETYLYQATTGQTAAQVAAGLLSAVVTDFPGASLSGAILTLPGGVLIGPVAVGSTGTLTRELGRQERPFSIIIWAPTPAARDAVAGPVDLALRRLERFTLPDGYAASLKYGSATLNDFDQKQGIFRRDLSYIVDYATTDTSTATEIVDFIPQTS